MELRLLSTDVDDLVDPDEETLQGPSTGCLRSQGKIRHGRPWFTATEKTTSSFSP